MSTSVEEQTVRMSFTQVIDYFNAGIEEAGVFLCLARSSKLQLAQCLILDELFYNATRFKREASLRGDEDIANLFLGFECAIGAARSELMMWMLLKRDMPNEAWDQMVAAQMGYLDATRAKDGFANYEQQLKKLERLESQIFPPQTYLSLGFVAKRLECSICGGRYSECEHLHGKPYMGQFCEIIHRDPRYDHVAVVETPEDKRCRVVSFKTKDGHRDKLSWEVKPYENGELYEEGEAFEARSICMAMDRYPYMAPTESILSVQLQAQISESTL